MANNTSGARAVEKLIKMYGCLPDAPDGPVLSKFNALELADAMEKELERAHEYGWSKMTLHMDLPDAYLLSQYLKNTKPVEHIKINDPLEIKVDLYVDKKDLNNGNTNTR
jgi:hypothetical protein